MTPRARAGRKNGGGPAARASERTWLFDLDNTLHNASPHIFPHINRSMVAYICQHLGLDEGAATQLREHYWQRYGATLLGLIRHHNTDADHFLYHTHQIPDLERQLVAEHGLRQLLHRLPGRKIVFSNAPQAYTEKILAGLGIDRCFSAVYCVERLRYLPKPATGAFLRLLRGEGLNPRRCVMVEDTLANLVTAKKLGMKTVWVSARTRRSPYADVHVARLHDLPAQLGRL